MVAATVTGLPSFLPGLKRHFFTASTAFSSRPKPEAALNPDVGGVAGRVHFDVEHHRALILGLAGFLGVFRLNLLKEVGADTPPPTRNTPPPKPPPSPGPTPAAVSGADAAALSRTDAAARASAVRDNVENLLKGSP